MGMGTFVREGGIEREQKKKSLEGAKFFKAYMECSSEIQAHLRELFEVVLHTEDDQERDMALTTIWEAVSPNLHRGLYGMDLEESEQDGASYSPEMKDAVNNMDREEREFALRLEKIMSEKGVSQTELAQMVGVSQPAISNMLSRQCRPQRRTIHKIAGALKVAPSDLWPAI